MDQELFGRAKRLMLLEPASGMWNEQADYPGPFYARKRRMTDANIRAHLQGEGWLASRLPRHGVTDRIVFDIDAKEPDDVRHRNVVYWELRRFLGSHRRVLAWQTPSGYGLRVACRIPPMPMRYLATSDSAGLLPEALRAAGLDPQLGTLEIYPAAYRCDRQLFGRRMPILDPETLEPVPGADLGDEFDEAKLRRAVDLVEEWYEQVDDELMGALGQMPRLPVPRDTAPAGPEPELRRSRALRTPDEQAVRVRGGLTRPHSRYATEFGVGRDMWLRPERFSDLGLPSDPSREDVALALARWLASHANGYSYEWTHSERRFGREVAIQWWAQRYARRNRTDDLAPVDRMRRAALAFDPDVWPTIHLSAAEHEEIHRIARHARWSGELNDTEMYRFEAWACACLRTAKRQIRRERWGATKLARARVEMKAEWMAGWPYGRRYTKYRDILERAGLLVTARSYRAPRPGVPGRAITYELPQPEWIRRGDLPMPVEQVEHAIESLRPSGRESTIDEAYHALHLADRGIELVRLYGRDTAKTIRMFQRALRPRSAFEIL